MLQREIQRAEVENRRNQSIISDYKQICSQLGQRLEHEEAEIGQIVQRLRTTVSDCPDCSKNVENLSELIDSKSSNSVFQEGVSPVSFNPSVSANEQFEQQASSLFDLKI